MGRYHPKRLLFAALVLLLLYVHIRHSQSDEFYSKTVKALDKKSKDKVWKEETDARVQKILNDKKSPQTASKPPAAAPTEAVDEPPRDSATAPSSDRKLPPADPPPYATNSALSTIPTSTSKASPPSPPHLLHVRSLLDEIVHHSIVIFSKTYCPHSERAKNLLLKSYDILPQPYVVELDLLDQPADPNHKVVEAQDRGANPVLTMGRALQDLLAERTGRKTVPNILVLGMSIGGADEVAKLDDEGELAGKLRAMVGKRLERCEKRGGGEEGGKGGEKEKEKDNKRHEDRQAIAGL